MARSGPWTFADGGETWRKDVKEVLAEDSGLYARVGGRLRLCILERTLSPG